MGSPRLSVVIPLFNKKETIQRAVKSVLQQHYRDFDLVIIDDGSTDGSAGQISHLTDPRIRCIRQTNAGVSAARNRGIAEAKGEYICLLDADDEWKPSHLQQIVELITINPAAGMYSNRYEVISPAGGLTTRRMSLPDGFRGEVKSFFSDYRKSRSLLNSSSVCVRRECFDKVRGFPVGEPVGEDVFVWLRIAESFPVMFDSNVTVVIHQDTGNRTIDRQPPSVPYYLKYYLNERSPRDLPRELQHFLASFVMIYAIVSVERGNRALPAQYSKMVWPISPQVSLACYALALAPRRLIEAVYFIRNKLGE